MMEVERRNSGMSSDEFICAHEICRENQFRLVAEITF